MTQPTPPLLDTLDAFDAQEPNHIANEIGDYATVFVAGLTMARTSTDPAMREWYAESLEYAAELWDGRGA